MSEKVLNNVRYILKHDTEENWKKASNFSPKNGEPIIYDIDSTHAKQRIKIGDGSTNVNNLPFIANDNLLESIKYVSESELSSEENLDASYQYCVTDLLSYDDLNSDLQAKIDKAASVDNKLDKVTEAGAYPRLYNIKPDGTQDTVSFTSSAVAYTVVQRDSNGDVIVLDTPISNNGATSKTYVDTQISSVQTPDDTSIQWSTTKSLAGAVSPIDAAAANCLSANRLAFGSAAGITAEYSNDGGSTWTDYGATDEQKISLISLYNIGGFVVGHKNSGITTNDQLRITLDANTLGIYSDARKLLVNFNTAGASCRMKMESQMYNTEEWVVKDTFEISGYSGWNSFPMDFAFGGNNSWGKHYVRLTFTISALGSASNAAEVLGLYLIGDNFWGTPSRMAMDGHLYRYDTNQNMIVPAVIFQHDKAVIDTIKNSTETFTTQDGSVTIPDYVKQKTNTDDAYYAYGYHNSEQISLPTSTGINPLYLVSRDANGDVKVPLIPTDNECAASKYYTDNTFVKSQSQYTSKPNYGVYTFALDGDTIKDFLSAFANYPLSYALAQYDSSAKLHSDPVSADDADDTVTNKGYVDAQISLVQDIANGANEDAANALTIAQEAKDLASSGTGRFGYGWQDGAGGPSGEPTDNRIYYLDRSTGEYYKWCDENCGLLQWVYKGSLKGPAGTAGAHGQNGAGWTLGSGSPSGEPSNNLLFYLDTSTGNYYHWEESYNNCGLLAWVLKGNLKGPKGDKGATGASGDSGIGSSYDAPSIINISNRCYGGVGGVANAVYGEGAFYRYLKVNNAQVESGTDLVISAETSMFPANLSIDSYGESSVKMASIVYSSSSVSSGNPGYSINVDSEGKVLTITSEDGAAHEVNFVMQYV